MAESPKSRMGAVVAPFRMSFLKFSILVAVSILALAALAVSRDTRHATLQMINGYDAMVLAYLSAYWGLSSSASRGTPKAKDDDGRASAIAERLRLAWSMMPTAMGSLGILCPMLISDALGSALLAGGYALLLAMEMGVHFNGAPPVSNRGQRWCVTVAGIVASLNTFAFQYWNWHVLF